MTRIAVVLAVAASLLVARAESKPNFTGRWELERGASERDPGESTGPRVVEVIRHDEPVLVIDRTIKRDSGDMHDVVKLRTDGVEVENPVGNGTVKSKSRWDDNKLITEGQMEGAPPLREVRETDDKGRMIVTMDFKTETESRTMRLVFVKK